MPQPHRALGGVLRLAAVALALTPVALAQTPTAASLAHKVDDHYNHLHSLTCRYTERYRGLGMDRSETGTLTLAKPGRMRWAYDSPVGKVFVLDGKFATSYTPGDAQATRLPESQLNDMRTPLRFLLGHTELAKELTNITLTLVGTPDHPLYTLSGTPKVKLGDPASPVSTIALTVDATGQIHTMRLEQIDGTRTDFAFTNMREDLPSTSADFNFIPPPGVTVINGQPPM
jgi:outer membrane lipoprotein carrier protein